MTARIDSALLARFQTLTAPLREVSVPLPRLEPGQVLRGRVLAVRGSQILIALLGEHIAAESPLPVQVGQVLDLVVRKVQPDRMTLEIALETDSATRAHQAFTDQDVTQLLAEQRLAADPINLLIARALIRQALPVINRIVLAARNALSFIRTPTAEEADAAIFLMVRDLPVTPQSLELAQAALRQPNGLGVGVQTLATQLVELILLTAQDSTLAALPRPLFALAQQVLQDLPLLMPDHAGGQASAALIRQVLDQTGTPTEARLARLLTEPDTVVSPPDRSTDWTSIHLPATKTEAVIITPLPASEDHPELAQADTRHTLPSPTQRRPQEATYDFRQQLARLDDTLAHAAAELPHHHTAVPTLHALQTTIRELISVIEANQLTNAGMPPPNQVHGYYLFHLPIAAAGQDATDTAEVRLYYQQQDRHKRVNPDNAHLAFLLQMSSLGSVDIHVDLYRKHLRCRIECSRQDATNLFQESSHELEGRLQQIGYTVDSIRSVTTRSADAPVEGESSPSLFKIDVQA